MFSLEPVSLFLKPQSPGLSPVLKHLDLILTFGRAQASLARADLMEPCIVGYILCLQSEMIVGYCMCGQLLSHV